MKKIILWIKSKYNNILRIKEDLNDSSLDAWNKLVIKYNISLDGKDEYQIGTGIFDRKNAEEYIEKILKPKFELVKSELELLLEEKTKTENRKYQKLNQEIIWLESQLKVNNEILQQKESFIESNRDANAELILGVFPEKKLKLTIDKFFADKRKQDKESMDNSLSLDLDETLNMNIHGQKIRNQLSYFKSFFSKYSEHSHSKLYPPTKTYIYIFYLISFLLLVGEIGFSINITNRLVNLKKIFPINYKSLNLIAGGVFSLAMSLSLAVLLYFLIDYLLFTKSLKNKIAFWVIFLCFCFLLLNFYSYDPLKQLTINNSTYNSKSIMVTFFSLSFAFANALVIREAIYLHHLYFRLNYNNNLFKEIVELNKIKKNVIQNIEQKKHQLNLLNSARKTIDQENNAKVNSMISKVENLNINLFWQGYEKALKIMLEDNKDLDIIFQNIFKEKLNL